MDDPNHDAALQVLPDSARGIEAVGAVEEPATRKESETAAMKAPTKSEIDRALYGHRSKYRNQRHNGYASKKEANQAAQLHALEKAGAIKALQEQVSFELLPKDGKERAVVYIADFTYLEPKPDGTVEFVVADAKGFRTDVFKLKRRMMWHLKGIRIRET